MTHVMAMRPIQIWPFYEAPPEYRALSPHGGDEDWIALIPPEWNGVPYFLESGSRFGCCDVSEHRLLDGSIVAIGAHA